MLCVRESITQRMTKRFFICLQTQKSVNKIKTYKQFQKLSNSLIYLPANLLILISFCETLKLRHGMRFL